MTFRSTRRSMGLRILIACSLLAATIATTNAIAEDAQPTSESGLPIQIGAATCTITPAKGSWVQGAGVARRAERIRDDLEANALYLTDGKTPLLLIGCDLIGLNLSAVKPIREAISKQTGIPPRQVIISCTHTHGGPSLLRTNYRMPVDVAYIKQLEGLLVELAGDAVDSARPGKLGWGKGEAQLGYNRRVCWADGTHSMHGNTRRPDFAGMEGPDDPAHLALFAVDNDEKPIAVLYHNTTHPTVFYAAGVFSSDFADETRKIIRRALGSIPVLFLNGAQGDIAMKNQLAPRNESREQRLMRIGRMAADETLRLYEQAKFRSNVVLGHTHQDLEIAVRLPSEEAVRNGREILKRMDAGEDIRGMKAIFAFGAVNLQERFGQPSADGKPSNGSDPNTEGVQPIDGHRPIDIVPLHAIRIGDLALVTQPCELYCQFGLDIKRRSPTPLTAVVGLTDAYCGYCPTIAGVLGGGYSGQPISWTRLEKLAGYRMVEAAGPMLHSLWKKRSDASK